MSCPALSWVREGWPHSFAKTPLNAAQLPLAAARASQGVLRTMGEACGGGDSETGD